MRSVDQLDRARLLATVGPHSGAWIHALLGLYLRVAHGDGEHQDCYGTTP